MSYGKSCHQKWKSLATYFPSSLLRYSLSFNIFLQIFYTNINISTTRINNVCRNYLYWIQLFFFLIEYIISELFTGAIEYRYSCDVCGKSYKNNKSLTRHIKYECQKEPNIQCSMCEYKAKYKAALKKHVEAVHLKLMNSFL